MNELANVVNNTRIGLYPAPNIIETMLGVTTNNPNTISITTMNCPAEDAPFPLPSKRYICTSCHLCFEDGREQRAHMKEPWQYVDVASNIDRVSCTEVENSISNVKRRIASLPPLPLDVSGSQKKTRASIGKPSIDTAAFVAMACSSDEGASDSDFVHPTSPFQCLFCNHSFQDSDTGFTANLSHMRIFHGLIIPKPEKVTDLQSFIGYLATEIRQWHECLYCGATKASTRSVQSHMRDKGHCVLNFDREPELVEFWESAESDEDGEDSGEDLKLGRPREVSGTEIHFTSGQVVRSRHAAPATKKVNRKREDPAASMALALAPAREDAESSPMPIQPRQTQGRQLARREEMSILGVSAQGRQALALAEKKAQRSEAVARRAREWVYAKGANSQKFDQNNNQMKWGKQNHKLQPR